MWMALDKLEIQVLEQLKQQWRGHSPCRCFFLPSSQFTPLKQDLLVKLLELSVHLHLYNLKHVKSRDETCLAFMCVYLSLLSQVASLHLTGLRQDNSRKVY